MRCLLLLSFTIPPDFLWGASTSGHQTEGGSASSDWRVLENAPGSFVSEPAMDAVDSFHHWGEDMDLLAAAGFTDYRFSIEWANSAARATLHRNNPGAKTGWSLAIGRPSDRRLPGRGQARMRLPGPGSTSTRGRSPRSWPSAQVIATLIGAPHPACLAMAGGPSGPARCVSPHAMNASRTGIRSRPAVLSRYSRRSRAPGSR